MAVYHFEYWKKVPKDMCSYLNQHSSKEEYKNIESSIKLILKFIRQIIIRFPSDIKFIHLILDISILIPHLDGINNEDTKIDQAVQRSFCWNKEMMNSLIYSALSRKIYIPNLILAEEKREDGTKQTYVVDGGQRTESLYQFKYCLIRILPDICKRLLRNIHSNMVIIKHHQFRCLFRGTILINHSR